MIDRLLYCQIDCCIARQTAVLPDRLQYCQIDCSIARQTALLPDRLQYCQIDCSIARQTAVLTDRLQNCLITCSIEFDICHGQTINNRQQLSVQAWLGLTNYSSSIVSIESIDILIPVLTHQLSWLSDKGEGKNYHNLIWYIKNCFTNELWLVLQANVAKFSFKNLASKDTLGPFSVVTSNWLLITGIW